ncbi:MAG TPA: endonuclease MutS2, partial [Planctomycetota bacterium]|nr:endonuclease MutS2 [Planctomycetota bacterium]
EALAAIARAAHAGGAIRKTLSALDRQGYPRLRALGDELPALPDLELTIVSSIDERAKVRSTASPRLGRVREEIEELKRALDVRVERISESHAVKPFLQSPKATLRNGRYVLPVKANHRHEVAGILHDKSQTGNTVYIEPHELVQLGNDLADRIFEERDEVTRILWDLTRACYERRDDLERLTGALGRVDFAFAKGKVALEYDMRAPRLVAEGGLALLDARHPLLLRMKKEGRLDGDVVPATIRLGGELADILIITGPNTGGKTVAIKTAGLLAAMAQAGLPVPCAEGSKVPFFTGFFASIGDEQAIEQSLSTFSAHVRELVKILAAADRGALVLVDELGAGTDPEEGAALGAAVLEALLAAGARVLVTTHLLSLKAFAYSRPRVENASVEFNPETLRPTYRLQVGVPGSSHAFTIARRHGMPEALVARAEAIRALGKGVGETALIDEVERLRFQAARDRDATDEARKAAESERRAVRAELDAAARERRAVLKEADAELEGLYEKMKELLHESRAAVQGAPKAALEWVDTIAAVLSDYLEHTPF